MGKFAYALKIELKVTQHKRRKDLAAKRVPLGHRQILSRGRFHEVMSVTLESIPVSKHKFA